MTWLQPPIVLQVVHCLDEAIDVLAFFTLKDEATAIKAFPLFRKLQIGDKAGIVDFCQRVRLLPSTAIRAEIVYSWWGCQFVDLEYELDTWASSVVELTVSAAYKLGYAPLLYDLSLCPRLETLMINWSEVIDEEQVDEILSAIGDSNTRVAHLRIYSRFPLFIFDMQYCTGLLAWIARPSSRRLRLDGLSFSADAAKALAQALLASTTLHTIKLWDSSNLGSEFVDRLSRPLPRQLRNLTLMLGEDWDDVETLAAKLACSNVDRLNLDFTEYRDVTRVLAVLPPTLRTLKLSGVVITSFPLLPALRYLQLVYAEMTNDAITGVAALLGASTNLAKLDLVHSHLPADQLEALFMALPRWLSRQKRMCIVRLSLTNTTAMLLATAMGQTRNTQPVQLEVRGDDDSLHLPARLSLLTALGATSQMRMELESTHAQPNDLEAIQTHCKAHRIAYSLGYFLSPCRLPWTLPVA
ncbi:hypothetical protein SPRG_22229 [Saprolegnia parasitica CBS 223.65]|uniref:F-box domain-containing protein n=1 Tax=Saprolegnia parasitica (strain CBS 223.65) TaxID=695850 RepID=A0A067CG70_SAPPC|nr:hypothetical protein SPRG_22229 [Saprolegnia parasitica CBS 223.65]KDO25556.1 hypothetical protein SPRG_22229 [Saprolegnia parasitica CBS 223.65]|eukprot:XP_012203796.1 hypothetical protein SPRG_22229 [Saprolegnia parasitica CBS 223.65]